MHKLVHADDKKCNELRDVSYIFNASLPVRKISQQYQHWGANHAGDSAAIASCRCRSSS